MDAVRSLEVTLRSLGGEARRKFKRTGKVLTLSRNYEKSSKNR